MAQATLNGALTDDGGLSCEVRFEYGIGAFTEATNWKSAVVGVDFYEIVVGLDPNTLYQFRAAARNSVGTSYGATLTFMTPVALAVVVANTPTDVLVASAILNGTLVNDGGESCHIRLQFGATVDYGVDTEWEYPRYSLDTLSQAISELASNTLIHFRAQAKNSRGLVSSADMVFRTLNADRYPSTGMDPAHQLILH